ncbi:MAG: class I SAM-dependent methyltransferase [Candidatus Glassbacteria bacterium]|nr:class I SAM-dependent methyltransferase [Candidatus Glassbacteria bacterium]
MTFPEWFNDKFGAYTREIYRDEVPASGAQAEAVSALLGPPGDLPLLDLCCGWGRHAAPLAGKGYRVVGLDGCRYFLEQVPETGTGSSGGSISAVRGDMRELPLRDGSFGAVIQMYTSFGYGTDPEDDRRVLGQVYRVLADRGCYLLDLINWTVARRAFNGKYEQAYPSFDMVEDCRIGPENLLRVKRALLFRDGRKAHIYEFEIRMFGVEDLTVMLEDAGFRVVGLWGDFDRSPYQPHRSYRMIAIAVKGAR